MQSLKTNRFSNIFVLVLVILVTLPCSVKREFKSILDIPISSENMEFQKTKTSCSVDVKKSSSTIKTVKKVAFLPNSFNSLSSQLVFEYKAVNPIPLHYSYLIQSTVRLHQLIEQYII